MQVNEALAEMLIIRLALREVRRQLSRIDALLDGTFDADTDKPLDEEARVRSAAGLALDELGHVLSPIERITGSDDTEVLELDDSARSELLEQTLRNDRGGGSEWRRR